MWNYWGVEAALPVCLRFFVLRSFGVALCWKSKDYWCQKEVPSRTFLVVGKTLVIFTILIWCLPRIHDNLLCSTSIQIIWLQIEGKQEDLSIPVIAHEVWCVCIPIWGKCMHFSVLNLTHSIIFWFVFIH